MASKATIVDEPVARDLEDIRIAVDPKVEGDARGIYISYRLRDEQGVKGHDKHILVEFDALTTPQKNALRNVIAWALARVISQEGPFT